MRLFKKSKEDPNATVTHCAGCGASLCGYHSFSAVDGNNRAITLAMPNLCAPCYQERYGVR
jgi:hypothetical protein